MKWVTRQGARVDRVACPWVIKKFIDPQAQFLFVPVEQVLEVAQRERAIPFDSQGAELDHKEGKCTLFMTFGTREVNSWMGKAFASFIEESQRTKAGSKLFTVAMKGLRHERVIHDLFAELLRTHVPDSITVITNYGRGVDITMSDGSRVVAAIEVKCPMTNSGGVRDKTRKPGHLPNDAAKLAGSLQTGAMAAYEFVVLIECFGVGLHGYPVPVHGIRWPTSSTYTPAWGEGEVEATMKRLQMKRIQGWTRVALPKGRTDVAAFLDCALYKMNIPAGRQ
ncbi:MAG: chromate resistance protein [Chloroflexi bacterium]|nr:chromate resistance protein [Chloroflexota bacterium]